MEHSITRQEYIKALEKVQERVFLMGMAATRAVSRSMKALLELDQAMAAEVMAGDDQIDDMIIDIEDRCMLLIAKQQPIAHDLRVLATGFKISTDLERIGDHAFDMAKTVSVLAAGTPLQNFFYTRQLAECAVEMLNMAMDAYRRGDVPLAEAVCHKDDEMDDLFARTFMELSHQTSSDAELAGKITQLMFVARFLERIGDHATNIAEWVIYLETAERIRKIKGKPEIRG